MSAWILLLNGQLSCHVHDGPVQQPFIWRIFSWWESFISLDGSSHKDCEFRASLTQTALTGLSEQEHIQRGWSGSVSCATFLTNTTALYSPPNEKTESFGWMMTNECPNGCQWRWSTFTGASPFKCGTVKELLFFQSLSHDDDKRGERDDICFEDVNELLYYGLKFFQFIGNNWMHRKYASTFLFSACSRTEELGCWWKKKNILFPGNFLNAALLDNGI